VRRFVIGTAGHVDHGKTTLVRALTGVDTDRLPEEKRRGITIELGFAPWDLGDGVSVSVIDVPGHRRLVHAMIAGAIGMELVLLVVAADEGVMPQTREHVAACDLLGIRRAVVAVTKLDRVGEEVAQLAAEEALELLGGLSHPGMGSMEAEAVLCSARTGEGIPEVRAAVRRALDRLGPPRPSARARLSVDRIFSVRGAGTVVTGTLVEGAMTEGAPLVVVGEAGAQATAARGLHVHDQAVTEASAPTRLAINLAGLSTSAICRGDVVTDATAARATGVIDVALTLALEPPAPLRRGASVMVYVGTARSEARFEPIEEAPTEARPCRLARLCLARPLVVFGGDRFVIRGAEVTGPAGAVLGGGTVLDAAPPQRRPRAPRRTALAALAAGDAMATTRALVEEAAPRPLLASEGAFSGRFPITEASLRRAAESLTHKGELVALKGRGLLGTARLAELASAARRLTAAHHAAAPLDRGVPLETLRQQLARGSSPEAAAEALRLASAAGAASITGEPIVIEGDVARVAGADRGLDRDGRALDARDARGAAFSALQRAEGALSAAALKGMSEFAIRQASGASPRDLSAILAKLGREGAAVRAGELWFSRAAVDALRRRVIEHFSRSPRITIAEFKALSGVGRKQAIVLLELLDREGVTRREGDDRLPAR
jgi:selenocysteine-specific elongation factor